jgi:hypothetical protein
MPVTVIRLSRSRDAAGELVVRLGVFGQAEQSPFD